ncbi:hypothetical protein CHLNCDRAFT_145405 [Chlorella variabilis]|uniref:Phytocyanin domain-containing protein n=1 Tax=Chlorella variabilis TaxID=554065 RepID=E1ZEC7_CHLVA|nr:hypothetical protein CHLNCDRAFT_145405 [Chlorella variabilis]EFN56009.1 hypothetical protein CHLNCDRAFT_145405 [Chlorella variabilis]|eukprot:XP_005848111.1 hypothetical protein CHLNCDRAFT_145405 [Chlorella variabilis]
MAPVGAPSAGPTAAPSGTIIPLVWDFQTSPSYPDQTAKVGDTVEFTWTGFHGVYRVPDGTCPASYSPNPPLMVEVAPETSGGAASFEFDAPGDYFFACQVPGHCDGGGMIVKYTVA